MIPARNFGTKLLLILLLLICSPAHAEQIKIGVLVPLTGDSATTYGEQVRKGVLLAKNAFDPNDSIQLIFEDSKCKVKDAITGARKLVSVDKVFAIIGDVCWTDLIAPITEPKKVVVMSTGSAQSTVREAGDYVFRLKLDVSVDSRKLANAIYSRAKLQTASLMYAQSDWGEGIISNFKDEFIELGGEIVSEDGFDWGADEFRATLLRLKHKNPEIIMIAARPPQVGLIAKQARQLSIKSQFAAYRGGIGDETIELGGSNTDGLMFLEEFDLESKSSATKNFVSGFLKSYDSNPNLFGVMGYDAFQLLHSALSKCSEKAECVRDYLYEVKDYDGASGNLTFDAKGDVQKPLQFKTIRDGKFVDF